MTDFEVTRQELVLDAQNTTTGWYDVHYNDSTIEMSIQPKNNANTIYEAGHKPRNLFNGLTADLVKEHDRVIDKQGVLYEVLTVEPFCKGSTVEYFTTELEQVNEDLAAASYTASSSDDSMHRTLSFLNTYLLAANLPNFITAYSYPKYGLSRVFIDKAIDIVFSFSKPTTKALYQADRSIYAYEDDVPIVVSAIDKNVAAEILLWQAETELRRIWQTYAFGSLRIMNTNRDKTTYQGALTLRSAEFTFTYRRDTSV